MNTSYLKERLNNCTDKKKQTNKKTEERDNLKNELKPKKNYHII